MPLPEPGEPSSDEAKQGAPTTAPPVKWWHSAAQHWQLTTAAIAVVAAVGGLAGWAQFFSTPDAQPAPTPQVTVQVPAPYTGPRDSTSVGATPEQQPGQVGCRDNPDGWEGLSGWGPPRNLLPKDKVSDFAAFNIDDLPPYGNERWFLDVRDKALPKDSPWQSQTRVEPDKTYILRAFIHNSAGDHDEDTAHNTRIGVLLPTCTGKRIATQMTIEASNAVPPAIWDSAHFFADTPFNLAYVEGTAVLCNNHYLCKDPAQNDGAEISNDFLTSTGALIGFDSLNGTMRGGYSYSAYFYFEVRAQFVPSS